MEATLNQKVSPISGICSTCIHLDDCLHRLESGQVIWFCEEFDDFIPTEPLANTSNTDQPESPDAGGEFMGLCVNCEHRDYCVQAKTDGGVWFCEEYR